MKAGLVVLCSAGALLVGASSVSADGITFTDRAAFQGALTSSQLITFDQFPLGEVAACGGGPASAPCVFPVGAVTFVGGHGDVQSQFGITRGLGISLGSPSLVLNVGPANPDDFFALFSGNAFGVDIDPGGNTAARSRVILTSAGGTSTVDLVGPGFVGAISETPFTSAAFQMLRFGPNNTQLANFTIDNVVVGSAVFTPTPEPATLLLLGLGAAVLTKGRSRRKV